MIDQPYLQLQTHRYTLNNKKVAASNYMVTSFPAVTQYL